MRPMKNEEKTVGKHMVRQENMASRTMAQRMMVETDRRRNTCALDGVDGTLAGSGHGREKYRGGGEKANVDLRLAIYDLRADGLVEDGGDAKS